MGGRHSRRYQEMSRQRWSTQTRPRLRLLHLSRSGREETDEIRKAENSTNANAGPLRHIDGKFTLRITPAIAAIILRANGEEFLQFPFSIDRIGDNKRQMFTDVVIVSQCLDFFQARVREYKCGFLERYKTHQL